MASWARLHRPGAVRGSGGWYGAGERRIPRVCSSAHATHPYLREVHLEWCGDPLPFARSRLATIITSGRAFPSIYIQAPPPPPHQHHLADHPRVSVRDFGLRVGMSCNHNELPTRSSSHSQLSTSPPTPHPLPGSHHEVFISDEQLAWLERQLQEHPDRPFIVLTHAPPMGCGLKVRSQFGPEGQKAPNCSATHVHPVIRPKL